MFNDSLNGCLGSADLMLWVSARTLRALLIPVSVFCGFAVFPSQSTCVLG